MAHYVDNLEDENLLEADEIELIEGEQSNENADNDNPQPDGESESAVKVEPPKKRIVRKPLPKLNPERLKGPRGLIVLKSWFKDVQLKGKGHEKEDVDAVMCRLEQWTHRLFPKFTFDDALTRIEKLGHKVEVANYLKRIRLDMVDEDDVIRGDEIIEDKEDDEPRAVDSFDVIFNQNNEQTSNVDAVPAQNHTLTDEQRERMVRNRLLAEERRLARAKARVEEEARLLEKQQEPNSIDAENSQNSIPSISTPSQEITS